MAVGDKAIYLLAQAQGENLEALTLAGNSVDCFFRLLESTTLASLTELGFTGMWATPGQRNFQPGSLMERSTRVAAIAQPGSERIPHFHDLAGLDSFARSAKPSPTLAALIGADRAIAERLADAFDGANLTALDLRSNHLGCRRRAGTSGIASVGLAEATGRQLQQHPRHRSEGAGRVVPPGTLARSGCQRQRHWRSRSDGAGGVGESRSSAEAVPCR